MNVRNLILQSIVYWLLFKVIGGWKQYEIHCWVHRRIARFLFWPSLSHTAIHLMHWRHKGSHLHNNDASLVSRSAHVLCWQCALALGLSVRGPGRASPAVWLAGFAPWLHAWRWRTWQCFVWPPTQLGALLWRHMHMVYTVHFMTTLQ